MLNDVGNQIEEDIARRDNKDAALNQQDVACGNGGDEHSTDAGPLENRLDIDSAAENKPRLHAKDRRDVDERRLESVPEDD
jgi:hypothetical protein